MSQALAAMEALHIAADVADRVFDEMVLTAVEVGHVTTARFLQIVIDEGINAAVAVKLREKLRVTSAVPLCRVSAMRLCCCAAATMSAWHVAGGDAAGCRGWTRVYSSRRDCCGFVRSVRWRRALPCHCHTLLLCPMRRYAAHLACAWARCWATHCTA
jgi:hypothetical protein